MTLLDFVNENEKYTHLKDEWNEEKNGPMDDYAPHSGKKVGWICRIIDHHEWMATVDKRTHVKPTGCPICINKMICPIDACNSFYFSHPELRATWDENKNGDMKKYFSGEKYEAWWKCPKVEHHSYQMSCNHKTDPTRLGECTICSHNIICPVDACNSVWATHPELRNEWNDLNGDIKTFFYGTRDMLSWICPIVPHHEWRMTLNSRTSSNCLGCTICSNSIICPVDACNSLYKSPVHKYLRKEWDYSKNDSMKNYFPCSNNRMAWLCPKVDCHKYSAKISDRTSDKETGCPICRGLKICPTDQCNSIYNLFPELRKEWDVDNVKDMKAYPVGSNKIVSWICSIDGKTKWNARIASRTSSGNLGCINCKYKSEQKCRDILEELLDITFEKSRPKFLKGLELDGYNKKKKIAFEYNGRQHYQYDPTFFHKGGAVVFEEQQKRDKKKRRRCKRKGITLITIPYTESKKLREYIIKQLDKHKISHNGKDPIPIDSEESETQPIAPEEIKVKCTDPIIEELFQREAQENLNNSPPKPPKNKKHKVLVV